MKCDLEKLKGLALLVFAGEPSKSFAGNIGPDRVKLVLITFKCIFFTGGGELEGGGRRGRQYKVGWGTRRYIYVYIIDDK